MNPGSDVFTGGFKWARTTIDELLGKCVATRALRVCGDALCVFLLVILPVVLSQFLGREEKAWV
jgi:hypothetical protein